MAENFNLKDHLGIHLVRAEIKFGAVIFSSNLLRLCLKLTHVFCSFSGSQVG
jgi:hypothetical protein